MKPETKAKIGRRNFLQALGAGAVLSTGAPFAAQAAAVELDGDKKRVRYQANSSDVQNFYRVNRYPK